MKTFEYDMQDSLARLEWACVNSGPIPSETGTWSGNLALRQLLARPEGVDHAERLIQDNPEIAALDTAASALLADTERWPLATAGILHQRMATPLGRSMLESAFRHEGLTTIGELHAFLGTPSPPDTTTPSKRLVHISLQPDDNRVTLNHGSRKEESQIVNRDPRIRPGTVEDRVEKLRNLLDQLLQAPVTNNDLEQEMGYSRSYDFQRWLMRRFQFGGRPLLSIAYPETDNNTFLRQWSYRPEFFICADD
jgi:hypothetical protein